MCFLYVVFLGVLYVMLLCVFWLICVRANQWGAKMSSYHVTTPRYRTKQLLPENIVLIHHIYNITITNQAQKTCSIARRKKKNSCLSKQKEEDDNDRPMHAHVTVGMHVITQEQQIHIIVRA